MAVSRRLGVENSEVRGELIDAAAEIIRDEGYAAVTARRLADKVGLKRQIVHYYFGTIEDLLIAVIRRDGENIRTRLSHLLDSDDPLRAIWQRAGNATATVFELTAIALRSKAVKAEVKKYTVEFRRLQVSALERHLDMRGLKSSLPAPALVFVIHTLAQSMAVERALGVSEGHAQVKRLVDGWLDAFAERGEFS
jgi:TetR/AcrR family transcriptional regulator